MTVNEAIELLSEEYDAVEVVEVGSKEGLPGVSFRCYLEYLEETHIVTIEGQTLWAYNAATNHTWAIN